MKKSKTRRENNRLKFDFQVLEPRQLMAADAPAAQPEGLQLFSFSNSAPEVTFTEPMKSSDGSSSSPQSFTQILVKENGRNLSRRGITTTNATIHLTATASNSGRAIATQPTFAWQTVSQPAANAATLTASGSGLTIRFNLAGSYQFRVSSGAVSTTFSVKVVSAVAGFSVTPDGASLTSGTAQRYYAQPVDQFGIKVSVSGFAVQWSSTGGTIDASGNFVAGSQPGTYSVTATATAGLSGSRSVQVAVQPRQKILSTPIGDATAQTTKLTTDFAAGMASNSIVVLSGNYVVNGAINLTGTGHLQIEVVGSATISTAIGSDIRNLIALDSAANAVTINGGRLTINGDDRIKAGIRLDNSGGSENGFVHIENVEVNDCFNSDNAFDNSVTGIAVIGKYGDVIIKNVKVKEARNTGTNLYAEVSGISVVGFTGHCHIDNAHVVDITNANLSDADGIKVFGDRSGFDTGTTANYVPQTALIENSLIVDCQGRGIKFQTSEAEVRSTKIQNLNVASIANGVGIAFQWGNGIVANCNFEYASGMVGASYSVINFQNVLENVTYQQSRFSNSHIKTVDAIPRIVSIQEENGPYLGTGDCRVEVLNITGERTGGVSLVDRAFVEHVTPQRIVDKTGATEIIVKDCVLPLTGVPMIGYVSYMSGDLSTKLDLVVRGNRNTLVSSEASIPVDNLSGSKILAYGLDCANNEGFNYVQYLQSSGLSSSPQSFSQILVKENVRTLSRRGITTTNATIHVRATAANRGTAISIQPTFAWQTVSQPAANAVTLSASGSGLTLRFNRAGSYQFRVSFGSVSTTFSVKVVSAVAGFSVTPDGASLSSGAAQRYYAQPVDQFGNSVSVSRFAVRWSATGGSIDASGNFVAGSQPGTFSVTATATAGLSGSRSVQVAVQPRQLTQGTLRQLVDSLYTDQLLDRNEIMQVLRSVGSDDLVSATELSDLRYLATQASGYRMHDHVRSLATDVLNSNPANLRYQGTALGNLQAGSSADQLNRLVDKWFLGTDLPTVTAGSGLTYQWAAGSLFNQTPNVLDTKQGQVGNCYFLASMSSIALRNPAAISNMFINNGDNTFTVRFFTGEYGYQYLSNGQASAGFTNGAGTPTYITVNRMLPATSSGRFGYSNMGLSLSSTSVPLWLAIAEKAYAQWNETGRADRNGTNTYFGIESGWMTDVNAQVIGTNSTTHWLTSSSKANLLQAINSGEAVTIGTTSSANQAANWVPNHAYVVTRYNSATDTFDLHNPWGTQHMPNVSFQQLLNNCDAIVVSSQVGSQVQMPPQVRGENSLHTLSFAWHSPSTETSKTSIAEPNVRSTPKTAESIATVAGSQRFTNPVAESTAKESCLVLCTDANSESQSSKWEPLDQAFELLET